MPNTIDLKYFGRSRRFPKEYRPRDILELDIAREFVRSQGSSSTEELASFVSNIDAFLGLAALTTRTAESSLRLSASTWHDVLEEFLCPE